MLRDERIARETLERRLSAHIEAREAEISEFRNEEDDYASRARTVETAAKHERNKRTVLHTKIKDSLEAMRHNTHTLEDRLNIDIMEKLALFADETDPELTSASPSGSFNEIY